MPVKDPKVPKQPLYKIPFFSCLDLFYIGSEKIQSSHVSKVLRGNRLLNHGSTGKEQQSLLLYRRRKCSKQSRGSLECQLPKHVRNIDKEN